MIYDIAVGAFIALVAFDVVQTLADRVHYKIHSMQRAKRLRALIDEWDSSQHEYQFGLPPKKTTTKKAPAKKKPATKRK
jgi:hypothetical protein